MSFTRNTPVNSGPLIIRTVFDEGLNNTYVLDEYDVPVPINYIMITSNNGLLVPTRDPFLNSITTTSSIYALAGGYFNSVSTNLFSSVNATCSTICTSSLSASTFSCLGSVLTGSVVASSTIYSFGSTIVTSLYVNGTANVNGPLMFKSPIVNLTATDSIVTANSNDWWGHHVFILNSTSNTTMILYSPLNPPFPPDGAFLYITNAVTTRTTSIQNLMGGSRSLSYLSTAHVTYNSTLRAWYSIS